MQTSRTLRLAAALGAIVAVALPGRSALAQPELAFSTYLGGNETDVATDVAVDAAGNTYVVGHTQSDDFPITAGSLPNAFPGFPLDPFVTKLDPTGAAVFSIYLDVGNFDEAATGIAVAPDGRAWVTGWAESIGDIEVFVAALAPDGRVTGLQFLIGSGSEQSADIALGPDGNLYVVGFTTSEDFPTERPAPAPGPGGGDVFVVKLSPSLAVLAATQLGGSGFDEATGVAVDGLGNVHVTGVTPSVDFPTLGAAQPSFGGDRSDCFVAKLDPADLSLVGSTYLGGSRADECLDVASDAAGSTYVTGRTFSPDFPVRNALQPSIKEPPFGDSDDAFVTKLGPTGSLVFSTYLGGTREDAGLGIAVDATGSVALTGVTGSTDFPLVDPIQAGCEPSEREVFLCIQDAFVALLDPQGSSLLFSTYLGGSFEPILGGTNAFEQGQGIAFDAAGNLSVAGVTGSVNFPTVNAFQPEYGGEFSDGFAARIIFGEAPDCSAAVASPAVLWPPNGKLVPVSVRGVTDPDGDPVQITITGVTQDEPLTGPFDASGVGSSTVLLRASRDGRGDGRVYRVSFAASDGSGGTCAGTVTVCVPHDRRPGGGCRDGGALVGSAVPGS